jgi:hypothetical protein
MRKPDAYPEIVDAPDQRSSTFKAPGPDRSLRRRSLPPRRQALALRVDEWAALASERSGQPLRRKCRRRRYGDNYVGLKPHQLCRYSIERPGNFPELIGNFAAGAVWPLACMVGVLGGPVKKAEGGDGRAKAVDCVNFDGAGAWN